MRKKLLIAFALILSNFAVFAQPTTIVAYGDTWKYLDNNTRPTNWQTSAYSDVSWASGPAELGYGDGGEATIISYGGVASSKYWTTYFRKTISISTVTNVANYTLNLVRDDGAVVYINGVEVARSNMPTGTIAHTTAASSAIDGAAESTPVTFTIPTTAFVVGNNTIAVEIHQRTRSSSDISFRLELISNASAELVPFSTSWKYLANNTRPTDWEKTSFSDAAWTAGNAELGYGDGGEATVVPFGPSSTNKYITTYFRKTINIADINAYSAFTLNLVRDDGAVVYVNGVEVVRSNMPSGAITHTTLASTGVTGAAESAVNAFNLTTCNFVQGDNVIAVEVHQDAATSSDLSFRLQLVAVPVSGALALSRGPYLQAASETGLTFRWRTNNPTLGRVRVGSASGSYTVASATESCPTTEHIVRIENLQPDTKYFYEIGTSNGVVLQAGAANFFRTNPPTTTKRKIRITAFGDCGRLSATYQDNNLANYQSYLTANGIDAPDAWILMGDNAYSSGTDAEYSSKFFGIYEGNILKNHKLYPSPGNHDYGNSSGNKTSRSMPYHNNFTVPLAGEAGGVGSNKQNYYSYNVGNIHFLSLDSYGTESDGTSIQTAGASAMKTWLEADLAANTSKWIIAYWHHPPYTKSSHNSDTEADLVNIRQNFITYLESKGVDLIICGHSHAYERGYLTKNYTTTWAGFNPATHAVSTSSAKYTSNTSCPYVYNSTNTNHGTVYVVAGSAGASGGTQTEFGTGPMPFAVNDAGILYFEVEDNRLDAKMLRRNGTIFDNFTIIKDANTSNVLNVVNGSTVNLEASWPKTGNYTWTGITATSRQTSVTPPNDASTVYTVADEYGCVTDQFTVVTTSALRTTDYKFDAIVKNNQVALNWIFKDISSVKNYLVEKSNDGKNYTAVAANFKNSATSYIDEKPFTGYSFYRLSIVNNKGEHQIVAVKKVHIVEVPFEVKTNATVGQVQINVASKKSEIGNVKIYDLSGKVIRTEQRQINKGNTNLNYSLNKGNYIVEISNKTGFTSTSNIVVQ